MMFTQTDDAISLRTGFRRSDLDIMEQVFRQFPTLEKVVLFGSRAERTAKNGSDIDLAVWFSENDATARLTYVLNEETLLPYFADVVSMGKLQHQALREQINRVGIVLFQK